jgi:hypothetical protein
MAALSRVHHERNEMNTEYEAALRTELSGLELSPDRPAKDRRIKEIKEQLGEAEPSDDAPARGRRSTAKTETRGE